MLLRRVSHKMGLQCVWWASARERFEGVVKSDLGHSSASRLGGASEMGQQEHVIARKQDPGPAFDWARVLRAARR